MTISPIKGLLTLIPAVLALSAPALAAHPKNIIERHPTLTGAAAGLAAHHALKARARYDKAHGKKLNFAEKHPTMVGIGGGLFARHEIKKHTPK